MSAPITGQARDAPASGAPARPAGIPAAGLEGDGAVLIALLLAHTLAWTIYGTIALGVGVLHADMVEAWVWGQEPQLGYFKHPPLMAWVTYLWFRIMPAADWSYYLLASSNGALGLADVAALARHFGLARQRVASVALLVLTPLYGILALKFNANAVLIALWPWATVAFLTSLERRRARDGLVLGLLSGLAMLGKYYSLLLMIAFFMVSLLPRFRQQYYRSPAPYVAAVAGIAVILPHVAWLFDNQFAPFAYAASKFKYPILHQIGWALEASLAPILFLLVPVLLQMRDAGLSWRQGLARLSIAISSGPHAPLVLLASAPFLLTLLFGFVGHAKVSLSYTIPIFFCASILLLTALPPIREAPRPVLLLRASAVVLLVPSCVVWEI